MNASKISPIIRHWLLLVIIMVFAMVLIGGATRLTDSGLSITEWKPITGTLPPLNEAQWLSEFEKYKTIPQYQSLNKGMSLQDFKFIYYWEWGHRFWGRLMALVFALPFAIFWAKGMLPQWLKKRGLILLALGAGQGALGWFMVMSGLKDRVDVAPLRLAAHLTLACILLCALTYTRAQLKPKLSAVQPYKLPKLLVIFVFIQIFLGGLVAGLDAGLSYNTWPLMDGALMPPASILLAMQPAYLNVWENVATVQWIHRTGAYALLSFAFIVAWHAPQTQKTWGRAVLALIFAQASIGIATLLLHVPIFWALLHQAGGLVVLMAATLWWQLNAKHSKPALNPQ